MVSPPISLIYYYVSIGYNLSFTLPTSVPTPNIVINLHPPRAEGRLKIIVLDYWFRLTAYRLQPRDRSKSSNADPHNIERQITSCFTLKSGHQRGV